MPYYRQIALMLVLTVPVLTGTATPPPALAAARVLADAAPDPALREELRHDVATALARAGERDAALALAAQLGPGRRGMVLLELAAHLPDPRGKEAEQFTLDAQTDKAMTNDWRKARLARLLAVAQARLGHFEAAEAMAREVPDTEEKAFALRDVVAELNLAGQAAKARELAGAIEENRRYGTYRQKCAALVDTARTLHARGDSDDATTLLAQAELLLPKKPGWSDGEAIVAVATAAHACSQGEKARELLTNAEALAQSVGGEWKVDELCRVAAGWRMCGNAERAEARLAEAGKFLTTLTMRERAMEALVLARTWAAAASKDKARALLTETLTEASRAKNPEACRPEQVRALIVWAELFNDAKIP